MPMQKGMRLLSDDSSSSPRRLPELFSSSSCATDVYCTLLLIVPGGAEGADHHKLALWYVCLL